MSYLNKKSDPFNPRDDAIPAGALNNLREGVPRQLQGGDGIDVERLGDRYLIRDSRSVPTLQDSGTMYRQFVVRQEYDDYLLCAPFYQPTDNVTGLWVPQGYDKDLESGALVFVYVAKPPHLQKSIWNTKSLTVGGDTFTVNFDGVTIGKRTVTDTGGAAQTQQITSPYVVGDVITARRAVTGLTAPNGHPVFWTDENDAGRQWLTTGYTGAPLNNAALFAGPVGPQVLTSISSQTAKYESWWRMTQTGFYYLAGGDRVSAVSTAQTMIADYLYALPYLVTRSGTIDTIAFQVAANVTGAKVRIGLYDITGDVDPYTVPNNLLFDSGDVTADTNTGTLTEVTVSPAVSVTAYTIVWVVIHANGTPASIKMRPTFDLWAKDGQCPGGDGIDNPIVGWYANRASYGSLPSLWSSLPFGSSHFVPGVFSKAPWLGVRMGSYT